MGADANAPSWPEPGTTKCRGKVGDGRRARPPFDAASRRDLAQGVLLSGPSLWVSARAPAGRRYRGPRSPRGRRRLRSLRTARWSPAAGRPRWGASRRWRETKSEGGARVVPRPRRHLQPPAPAAERAMIANGCFQPPASSAAPASRPSSGDPAHGPAGSPRGASGPYLPMKRGEPSPSSLLEETGK